MAPEEIMFDPVEIGDWDEAVEKANKVLIPGEYRVRIQSAKHDTGPKARYLGWRLETIDCPDPEDNGIILFYNTPIEGRGFSMFTDFCQALGVRCEGGAVTPDFVKSLYGSELTVETSITQNPNTKKDQSNVKSVVAAIGTV